MPEENKNQEEFQGNTQEDVQENNQTTNEPEKETKKESGDANIIALLSYLGILIIVPILVDKDNEFVKFHIKQGLVLLIVGIATMFIGIVPIIGWLLAPFILLACLIFAIIGIINVLGKKKKELPIIGKYANNFKI